MDVALDIVSKKIIEAEQLWLLSSINPNGFICIGCDAIVTPCSYQPQNKRRPYFSAKQGHKIDCDIDGEIELVNRARKGRVHFEDGLPSRLPQELVLQGKRPIVDAACVGSIYLNESPANQHIRK